jgi:hypothetical protein
MTAPRTKAQIKEMADRAEARSSGENAKEFVATALNEADSSGDDESGTARAKQSDVLIHIAKRGELFHNDDVAYADVNRNGHRETWPVRSGGFRRWLLHCYYDENGGAPNNDAVSTALGVIEADATVRGEEHPVAVRVGGHDGKIYVDLCNNDWQAIEIDTACWRVVDQPPIRFIRSRGMLPLPMPVMRKHAHPTEGD